MHTRILIAHRDAAEKAEEFWFQCHSQADFKGDTKNYNDYGWLWMHYRQAREKLDAMISNTEES